MCCNHWRGNYKQICNHLVYIITLVKPYFKGFTGAGLWPLTKSGVKYTQGNTIYAVLTKMLCQDMLLQSLLAKSYASLYLEEITRIPAKLTRAHAGPGVGMSLLR